MAVAAASWAVVACHEGLLAPRRLPCTDNAVIGTRVARARAAAGLAAPLGDATGAAVAAAAAAAAAAHHPAAAGRGVVVIGAGGTIEARGVAATAAAAAGALGGAVAGVLARRRCHQAKSSCPAHAKTHLDRDFPMQRRNRRQRRVGRNTPRRWHRQRGRRGSSAAVQGLALRCRHPTAHRLLQLHRWLVRPPTA